MSTPGPEEIFRRARTIELKAKRRRRKRKSKIRHLLVRLFGWKAALFHGDAGSWARYKWLKKHLKAGRLRTLDAGCGSGAFTMFAASIGNDALGLSFDEANNIKATERAKIANSKARFHTCDLREIEKHSLGTFDQIFCLEAIEHINDDLRLVKNLVKLLRPGGRLLLTTPYKFHRPYFEEWKTQSPGVESGGHVRFGYTHEEMRYLFNLSDLDVVIEDFHVGFVAIQIANLQMILNKILPHLGWAVAFPLRIFQPLDHLITRLLRYPYVSIGVVGVKQAQSTSTSK